MLSKFAPVFWLGGSPCAGKTTVSQAIAAHFGWRLYHCDDWFGDHRQRACPEKQPTFHAISRLRGDDLWLRPVAEQIATEIAFVGEALALALEDLAQMLAADSRPILFEGAPALPHLLQPLLPHPQQAVWLIPTESFQRRHYAKRPWVPGQLATTSDPELAFDNWMRRDAGFARWLEAQVTNHDMRWIRVDGSLSIAETVAWVMEQYQTVLDS